MASSLLPLLRGLLGNRPVPEKRRLIRRRRLLLEELEPRLVPSSVPLALTGFNQDLIYAKSESSAAAGTTTTFDGVNVLYESGAGTLPAANGLPTSGNIQSAANPAVSFSLAPYTSNNALFLSGIGSNSTLTLNTPGQYATLHILDCAADAVPGTNYQITLTFSDGSTATVTGLLAPDWIAGVGLGYPGAFTNLGRVDRANSSPSGSTATLFEADISVPAADQAKTLQSLTFQVTGGANIAVFAVSADPASPLGTPLQLGPLSQSQWAVNESGQTATISVSGGVAPYSGLTAAGMPTGLSASLLGSTITLSGTLTETGTYYVNIGLSDSLGDEASNWYTITATSAPSISKQPASAAIDNGQSDTMSVTATGGLLPYTYQWYNGSNSISGATSSTLTVSPTGTASYWVAVKGSNGATVDSNTATVTVAPALTITAPPASATIDAGQSDLLSVGAGNGVGTLSYQWYNGTPGSGTPISGATGSSYAVSPTSTGSYYVTVTDQANGTAGAYTVLSAAANVTVDPTLAITTPPASASIDAGQSDLLSVVAGNGVGTLSYQWYNGTPGSGTAINGATGSTYTASPTSTGSYYVTVTDQANGTAGAFTVASTAATITVAPVLGILVPPQSATIDPGQSHTLRLTATGGTMPYSYQWYTGSSGDTSNPVSSGGTSATLNVSPRSTTSYWVAITDSANGTPAAVADSSTATITVAPPLQLGSLSQTEWTVNQAGEIGTIAVSGGFGPDSGLTVTGLPDGLTAALNDGAIAISGAPIIVGTFPIQVSLTDSNHVTCTSTYTLTVNQPLELGSLSQPGSLSLPDWVVNQPGQTDTIVISGGFGPYNGLPTTGLPEGLSAALNGSAIVISGTPLATGSFPVQITLADSNGDVATGTFTLTVNPPFQLGLLLSKYQWTADQPGETGTINISGGVGPYSGLTTSGLPSGLNITLKGSTLTVSGMPTVSGTFNVQVSLTDANAQDVSGTFSITIDPVSLPVPTPTPENPANANASVVTAQLDTTAASVFNQVAGDGHAGSSMTLTVTSTASALAEGTAAGTVEAGSTQTLSASAPARATANKPFTQTANGNAPSTDGSDGSAAGAAATNTASSAASAPGSMQVSTDASAEGSPQAASPAASQSPTESAAAGAVSAFLSATQASISQKVAIIAAGSGGLGPTGLGQAGGSGAGITGVRAAALSGAALENALLFGGSVFSASDNGMLFAEAAIDNLDGEAGATIRKAAVDEAFANMEMLQMGMLWLALTVTAGELTARLTAKEEQ